MREKTANQNIHTLIEVCPARGNNWMAGEAAVEKGLEDFFIKRPILCKGAEFVVADLRIGRRII